MGVGLIGAGGFGHRLGAAVQATPGLHLVALHDPDRSVAAAAASSLGVPAIPELGALVEDRAISAVVVATPHATHRPIALAAAAAGCHLFVEKPLAMTVLECQAVIDAAERAGVALLVGHVTRLLPLVLRVREIINDGRIGQPLAAWMLRHQYTRRQGWFARRDEFGMVLHSPAIHNLDLMNLFLGRATSLVALAAKSIQEDVEYSDIVGVLIGYEHGRVGSLGATVSDPLYRQATGTSSARIVGDAGGLAFDVSTGRIELQTLSGPLQRFEIKTEDWGLDSGIAEELINFEAVIHNRAAPFVNSEEALRAVELCEAAEQSIQSGSIVRLPLTNGRSL